MNAPKRSFWQSLSPDEYRHVTQCCAGPATFENARELRWRTHGSVAFDLKKGCFKDFEADCGGDLVTFAIHVGAATDYRSAVRCLEDALGTGRAAIPTRKPEPPTTQDRSLFARRIWSQCTPLSGTLGADYLRGRAIDGPWPPTLRFHASLYCREADRHLPALVAAVVDLNQPRRVQAVQRCYLGPDGRKAELRTPKLSLGSCAGRGVLLGKLEDTLCIAEGVESALSAGRTLGLSAVAALGTSGLRTLTIPNTVRRAVIAFDRDKSRAGELAANDLAERLHAECREVSFAPPPAPFGDWNDWAMAQADGDQDE